MGGCAVKDVKFQRKKDFSNWVKLREAGLRKLFYCLMNVYLWICLVYCKLFRKKIVFFDIGELGWSLYLSGHIQWLKNKGCQVTVFTSADRRGLFECADHIQNLPIEYCQRYGHLVQDCYGLVEVPHRELKDFFMRFLSSGMVMPAYFRYGFASPNNSSRTKKFYVPYKVSKAYSARNILVFPRCRTSSHHAARNLPRFFYERLISRLCAEFPEHEVIAFGSKDGAHDISLSASNYRNFVGNNISIQDLVNYCSTCSGAVGGASAPPKITLQQGVPTYVIGHEKKRVTQWDNWRGTRVGFWEISENGYNDFNSDACIDDVVVFFMKNFEKPVSSKKNS